MTVYGIPIPIASVDAIISAKEAAGRDRTREPYRSCTTCEDGGSGAEP